MNVVHVLNLANNAYHLCKALNKRGFDSTLIIDENSFGMGQPFWERIKSTEIDPYDMDFKKIIEEVGIEDWIKPWSNKGGLTNIYDISRLFKLTRDYDLLHLHSNSPMWYQFTKQPFIIHESGWIRQVYNENSVISTLGKRIYKKAECIIMTNPDTYQYLDKMKHKENVFIPFLIPIERYIKKNRKENDELYFFHPTRQCWDVKGNDKFIHAFIRYIKNGYKAKLHLIEWGYTEDILEAKALFKKAGIEKNIIWTPPVTKPVLIDLYNKADAVFDQFLLGSGGTVCYEAMSCQTPVVIYLNEYNERCFGEMPPIINRKSIIGIYDAMVLLTVKKFRKERGRMQRKFILKHNSAKAVCEKLIPLYERINDG